MEDLTRSVGETHYDTEAAFDLGLHRTRSYSIPELPLATASLAILENQGLQQHHDLQSVCGEASVTLLGDMTGLDMSSDMVVATAAQGELASASPSLLILSPTAQPHSPSILWSRNHLESRLTRRLLSQKLSPTRSEQARTPPPSMDRKESQATLKVSSRGNPTGRREEGRVELDYLGMSQPLQLTLKGL
ncbi:hypothetical protein NM688_g3546 [Phlebia brevispora]|uniref:Uncharacterized protein n=1 Tax=Phlebia brevispora TaxID=194682 RepID=A0ACC1T5N0_9APHY|nr:hypothetical protein NM688_g3546 [Phlebia brevispora]